MATLEKLEDFTKACSTCDRQRYLLEPKRDRIRARRCPSCFETCPRCAGEKYEYVTNDQGYTFAKECPVCTPLDDRIELLNAANLPAKYHSRDKSLDAFSYQTQSGKQIGNLFKVLQKLMRWSDEYKPGERGFVLHGPVGTGKTHLMVAVLRRLILNSGVPSRFIEFTHLLSEIKQQFDAGKGESEIMAPLAEIEVLAIDELGKGRNTPWQLSIIDEIISKRYNRGLTTLFTTNYPLQEPQLDANASDAALTRQMTQETLLERIDERIFSRLHEMVDFIEIDAPDYRKRAR
jgi:DNA replication protein DnaC